MLRSLKILALVVSTCLALASSPARSQTRVLDLEVDDASRELGGTSSRRWVVDGVSIYLSEGGRCTKGHVFRFSAKKMVKIDRCEDGSMISEQQPWALRSGDPDLILRIGSVDYRARFRQDGAKRQLLLRKAARIKAVENEDILLTLSRD